MGYSVGRTYGQNYTLNSKICPQKMGILDECPDYLNKVTKLLLWQIRLPVFCSDFFVSIGNVRLIRRYAQ